MSTKYRNSRDVPLDTIIIRLNELSDAITCGRESQDREFTMRIPAECDRDADLVIGEAASRLAKLGRVRELAEQIKYIAIDSPPSNNMQLIYRLACQQAAEAEPQEGQHKRIRELEAQLKQAEARVAELEKDAKRYRLLRAMHWSENVLAVVQYPKESVKLGVMCPSGDILDSTLDIQLAHQQANRSTG